MIFIPKYKPIQVEGLIEAPRAGLFGEVRVKRFNCMGQVNHDTGWIPNLITNVGLDLYGQYNWAAQLSIGSSNTAEAYTDTALGTQLFRGSYGNGAIGEAWYVNPSSPYEFRYGRARRFDAGQGTGTVREIGLHGDVAQGSILFARKVLPAEITKAADEVLDVYWRITKYLPLGDSTGTVTIDGLVYDTTTRIFAAGSTQTGLGGQSGLFWSGEEAYGYYTSTEFAAKDNVLSAITATDGGTGNQDNFDFGGYGSLSYGAGNHYRDHDWNCGLDGWNLAAGIRTIKWRTKLWRFQTQYVRQGGGGETIPKDNTYVMENMRFRTSWTRHSGS